MSLNLPHIYHQLPLPSHHLPQINFSILHHHRAWKRRKLKKLKLRSLPCLSSTVCSGIFHFDPLPFENLYNGLISHFPSLNSLELIVPALGLASGAAIYFSQLHNSSTTFNTTYERRHNSSTSFNTTDERRDRLVGDWILFTSPTPFNRFVVLRCPSISLQGSKFLEDVNDKLMEEDGHFVRLNRGKIEARETEVEEEMEKLVYQRVCIRTDDDGVLSLDWPANLDMEEERGLDTTLLIVPGTTQGSMESDIKVFVLQCLKRGCFPVVMNPRGCAGSPVTTPRLFTAADSDDISTAIKFVNKARPWTTLMGIGLGYGANMLTKYLAEVGETTPLTAVTCIDNPFDLEEATRYSPYCLSLDQKITSGLKEILQSNKELFQGRAKRFDVENALLATSLRDFEKAISMVSYGFDEITDFYSYSSTRDLIGKVKIPVLFIQNDNGAVPLYSIPRSSIGENPFSSLILCSHPSGEITCNRSTISWCQYVSIEWLAAVELGLLKGRHPLLKDFDVTIGPTNGLALVENRAAKETLEENGAATRLYPRLKDKSKGGLNRESIESQPEDSNSLEQRNATVTDLIDDEIENPVNGDKGQVLQTAKVVMKMLDVSLPDSLTEEQKSKVLTAVGKGETVMTALQNAVPADVREKLTMSVSEILHNQGSNLKFDKFLKLGQIPDVVSTLRSNNNEGDGGIPKPSSGSEELHASVAKERVDDIPNNSNTHQSSEVDEAAGEEESDNQVMENDKKSTDVQSKESPINDKPNFVKDMNDQENNGEYENSSRERTNAVADCREDQETDGKPELSSRLEVDGDIDNIIPYPNKTEEGAKSETSTEVESKSTESSVDQIKNTPSTPDDKTPPISDEKKPSTPDDITLSTPDDRTPSSPDDKTPSTPDDKTPSTPDDKTLSTPDDKTPSTPDDKTPSTPDDKTPSTPDEKTPSTSDEKTPSTPDDKTPSSVSLSNVEVGENERNDNSRKETTSLTGSTDGGSKQPDLTVSQALDAFTGIDDSTQVAVSSIFNVLEDMITHLEEGKDTNKDEKYADDAGQNNENVTEQTDDVVDGEESLAFENQFNKNSKLTQLQESGNGGIVSSTCSNDTHSKKVDSEDICTKDSASNKKGDVIDFSQESDAKSVALEENVKSPVLETSSNSLNSTPKSLSINASTNLCRGPLYEHLQKFFISRMKQTKSLDLDKTTALFLDYIPEDQWKLLEQTEDTNGLSNDTVPRLQMDSKVDTNLISLEEDAVDVIEPSYVIVDSERYNDHINSKKTNKPNGQKAGETDFLLFVKGIVLDTLRLEVGRRLSPSDTQEMQPKLAEDLDLVANSVCLSISIERDYGPTLEKFRTLEEEHIAKAIYSAFQDTSNLRRVLPVGVVIGSCLASLGRYFHVDKISRDSQSEEALLREPTIDEIGLDKMDHKQGLDGLVEKRTALLGPESLSGNTVMVGAAAAAALGASALLLKQQTGNKFISDNDKNAHYKGHENGQEISHKNQNSLVTSLAEKAMSVAGPVVPTKEGGELDQERLVAMLAELGQKGGILKLVGKFALLWGGIRGALSLINKLITFLRLAERPLFQRMCGFVCMVLLLWSPIVIPFFPTLVQGWATHTSTGIAKIACIIGLYVSVMLMVTIWGKRIRGYANPLEQYGLDINSPFKFQNFFKGLTGGIVLVFLIHAGNFFCGFVRPSWPNYLVKPSNAALWLQASGKFMLMLSRGLVTATTVAVVEELLFRSWLPDEIAAEYGYYNGIIISGLAFSLCQRSPMAIPGLWLLSVALAGARQRNQGSLFVSIGLRAGILLSCFIIQTGGFLTVESKVPTWLCGSDLFQPFSGVFGLSLSLILAMILRPLYRKKKLKRAIKA